MTESPATYGTERAEHMILTVRGQKVILDSDLARIYGVSTGRLNEQVRRNASRFPADFAFELTAEEVTHLRSQIAISRSWGGRRYRPWAFTEHGAMMAANVLRSQRAVDMSVFVVRAFVRMRQEMLGRHEMEKRLDQIEKILLVHDDSLKDLYRQIRPLLLPPPTPAKPRIGFQVRERHARYGTRTPRHPPVLAG